MIELLSAAGLAELRAFVTPDTLFAFDLDGTLAPIVDDPAVARVPADVSRGLDQLSQLATTAVITGRARNDALPRLGFTPCYLVGNHGSEGLPGVIMDNSRLQKLMEQWLRQLQALLAPAAWSAIVVEQKGGSLSLHYRHAPQRDAVHAALLDAIRWLDPVPRRVGGKYVENLLPYQSLHKGDALLHLMQHSGCPTALFVGDDETDEDVFRLADPRIFTVCVGAAQSTAAFYHLVNQAAIVPLLSHLLVLLKKIEPPIH